MRCPPPLSLGDKIRVVAPSGPFDDEQLRTGLAQLDQFDISTPKGLWSRRSGFFAGSEEARLAELQEALDDPECRAILMARGGYGLGPLLPRLSFERFLRDPSWFVGFSDATAMHALLARHELCSLHAANGTTLARAHDTEVRSLVELLRGKGQLQWQGLVSCVPGRAGGPLFGGNLTVLFSEAASGRLAVPDSAILVLEDVTETSYRIDRMLCALRDAGHFARLAGVVLGEFTECSPGRFNVTSEHVLISRLSELKIPLAKGLGVGHGERNAPLLLGAEAQLNTGAGTLVLDAR